MMRSETEYTVQFVPTDKEKESILSERNIGKNDQSEKEQMQEKRKPKKMKRPVGGKPEKSQLIVLLMMKTLGSKVLRK